MYMYALCSKFICLHGSHDFVDHGMQYIANWQ